MTYLQENTLLFSYFITMLSKLIRMATQNEGSTKPIDIDGSRNSSIAAHGDDLFAFEDERRKNNFSMTKKMKQNF